MKNKVQKFGKFLSEMVMPNIHKITDYYFDQFSCLYKEVHTYDKELEEFCLKNKSVISIYDEYGRNVDWRL